MEFSDIGNHCHFDLCRQTTFLPQQCACCNHQFCKLHISTKIHKCNDNYQIKQQKQISKNTKSKLKKCGYKCDKYQPILINCNRCNKSFCSYHRYSDDHMCNGNKIINKNKNQNNYKNKKQNNYATKSYSFNINQQNNRNIVANNTHTAQLQITPNGQNSRQRRRNRRSKQKRKRKNNAKNTGNQNQMNKVNKSKQSKKKKESVTYSLMDFTQKYEIQNESVEQMRKNAAIAAQVTDRQNRLITKDSNKSMSKQKKKMVQALADIDDRQKEMEKIKTKRENYGLSMD
eukprot:210777_1